MYSYTIGKTERFRLNDNQWLNNQMLQAFVFYQIASVHLYIPVRIITVWFSGYYPFDFTTWYFICRWCIIFMYYFTRRNALRCWIHYGIEHTVVLNSLWYWTHYGIERTMVLNALWYWTHCDIERTMVLNALWYWTHYGRTHWDI